MGKTLYLYETTVNMDYWRNYMRRDLKDKEIAILKNTRCENMMNRKIKELYGHASSKNLFVPMLTNLHGNCIFESLQYHGLCDDLDDFRKGLAMLLLAVKNKKYFFPDQEMSLSEVFATRNEIEYVFCKNKKRLYKYNFDAMCMDLATDSSWRRLDTEIILSLDNSKSEYITQMRDQTTWGGAIEIQAACNLWNVRILVHNIKYSHNINIIEFLPINNTNYKGTINITWNGTHYEKKDNF